MPHMVNFHPLTPPLISWFPPSEPDSPRHALPVGLSPRPLLRLESLAQRLQRGAGPFRLLQLSPAQHLQALLPCHQHKPVRPDNREARSSFLTLAFSCGSGEYYNCTAYSRDGWRTAHGLVPGD
eukprot:768697-Hanusia_phi.AAC.2